MSDNKKYTAEDIQRYLEGGMSSLEMHALEREALNDPFLADAIEGIRVYDDKQMFFEESGELKKRINERVSKRKRILVLPMLWKVAAVLLVIVSGVAIMIYTSETTEVSNTEIAKTETPKPVPQKTDTPAAALLSDGAQIGPEAPRATAPSQSRQRIQPAPVEHLDTSRFQQQSHVFEKTSPATDSSITNPEKDRVVAVETLEGRAAGIDVKRNRKVVSDTIFGDSQFEEADQKLNEVVVVGYGASRKKAKADIAANSLQRRIVPEGGWDAFESYLALNKKPAGIDSAKKGIEKISFVINDKGRPSAIKIQKSLSKAHDKEVKRLLEEGPDWEVVRGKRRKITLNIVF